MIPGINRLFHIRQAPVCIPTRSMGTRGVAVWVFPSFPRSPVGMHTGPLWNCGSPLNSHDSGYRQIVSYPAGFGMHSHAEHGNEEKTFPLLSAIGIYLLSASICYRHLSAIGIYLLSASICYRHLSAIGVAFFSGGQRYSLLFWHCDYPTDLPGPSGNHLASASAGLTFSTPCCPLPELNDVYRNQSGQNGSYPAGPDAGRASFLHHGNVEMPSANDADPMSWAYTNEDFYN